ncbi:MAG: alanine racemase [Sulfurimonas sp.]|nr:alanine racemase [Sulfurimonas sp.]
MNKLKINLNNLLYNYNKLSSMTSQKVIVVVKANAYGHGAVKVAKYIEERTDSLYAFAVAKISEAIELKNNNIKKDIIILSETINKKNIKKILKYKLIPVVFDKKSLVKVIKIKLPYILKIDSGMNRLGFKKYDMHNIKDIVNKQKPILLMTHFSVAEDNYKFTKIQIENFNKIIQELNIHDIPISLSNSSALINGINNNIPRLGISMYGINHTLNQNIKFKTTMSLISEIITIKKVKRGEYISYGNTIVKKDTCIAVVAVGYADGYTRSLSNSKAFALSKYGKIKQIGTVCMDMVVFDILNMNLKIGDKILLFGENKFGNVPIEILSKKADTISYEFFTNRTTRAKVRYIQ